MRPSSRSGFTLTELAVSVGLFGLAVAGTLSAFAMCNRTWYRATLDMATMREANMAMEKMVYGWGSSSGLRMADTVSILNLGTTGSWRLTFSNDFEVSKSFQYLSSNKTITFSYSTLIATNVVYATASSNRFGLFLNVRVAQNKNRYNASNEVATYVKLRN